MDPTTHSRLPSPYAWCASIRLGPSSKPEWLAPAHGTGRYRGRAIRLESGSQDRKRIV